MKYLWMFIFYFGPGALGTFLISKYGLLCIWAVLAVEVVFMILHKLWNRKHNWGYNALLGVTLATIGMIIGFVLYPVPSDPTQLGIVAAVLTAIVHAGLYLIIDVIIQKISI